MVIFHSYVNLPEGIQPFPANFRPSLLPSPKRLWVATWSHQLVAPKWLTFMCFAWMVKVASWPSLLPPWAGKCGRWFWSNFRQREGETCTAVPCFTACARPNVAGAGHWRSGRDAFLHLCSYRYVCCMALCLGPFRRSWGRVCIGGSDWDARGIRWGVLVQPPFEPRKLDFWIAV